VSENEHHSLHLNGHQTATLLSSDICLNMSTIHIKDIYKESTVSSYPAERDSQDGKQAAVGVSAGILHSARSFQCRKHSALDANSFDKPK